MKVCELLPWFAAGSLNEGERVEVVLHLGKCALCRQELAFWQGFVPRLQGELNSMPSSPPAPQSPGDRLAHALVRHILHLVPLSIPSVTVYTAEVAFESPAGVMSLAKLPMPRVRSHNIADWLMARAGN